MIISNKDEKTIILGDPGELIVEFCMITEQLTFGLLKSGIPKDELLKLISDATVEATTNGAKDFAKEQNDVH